jgi:hypothetical protein
MGGVLLIYGWRIRDKNILIASLFSLFFSIIFLVDAILIKQYGTSFLLYSAHVYRYQPIVYLILFVGVGLAVFKTKIFQLVYLFRVECAILTLAAVLGLLLLRTPTSVAVNPVSFINATKIEGRFLETFSRKQVDPFWYKIQAEILEKNPKSAWAYGLFTDSSATGPFIGSLIKTLNGSKEKETSFIETRKVDESRIADYLDLFGINYLLKLEGGEVKIEKISNAEIFSIVQVPLKKVSKNWNREVEKWWFEKGDFSYLPYIAEKAATEDLLENKSGRIEILESSPIRYIFNVVSDKNVPVLAKISYFPYWKAYKNGEEVPIYRAGPNLMLLYTSGEVTLEYRNKLL